MMTHSYQILQAFHTTEYIYYILIQCILKFATGYQVQHYPAFNILPTRRITCINYLNH